nr:hypothetical protein [Tanacetum cinerariifolium]
MGKFGIMPDRVKAQLKPRTYQTSKGTVITQSEGRYLTIDRPDGAQVMDNNNNKAICASQFVLAYRSQPIVAVTPQRDILDAIAKTSFTTVAEQKNETRSSDTTTSTLDQPPSPKERLVFAKIPLLPYLSSEAKKDTGTMQC